MSEVEILSSGSTVCLSKVQVGLAQVRAHRRAPPFRWYNFSLPQWFAGLRRGSAGLQCLDLI